MLVPAYVRALQNIPVVGEHIADFLHGTVHIVRLAFARWALRSCSRETRCACVHDEADGAGSQSLIDELLISLVLPSGYPLQGVFDVLFGHPLRLQPLENSGECQVDLGVNIPSSGCDGDWDHSSTADTRISGRTSHRDGYVLHGIG